MKISKDGSFTESVYKAMRADLLSGRLEAGSRLKTAQLADQYGVSLAAIREALTRLSSEGLVDSEPQRGFRAAVLSAERLQDITEARIEIERLCIEKSIANFDVLHDVRLDQAMERLIEIATVDADERHVITDEWSIAHVAFHEALVAGCRNMVLLRLRRQLFDQSEPYRLLASSVRRKRNELDDDHRPLVEAVHARDAQRASDLIIDHIRSSTRMLLVTKFAHARPPSGG